MLLKNRKEGKIMGQVKAIVKDIEPEGVIKEKHAGTSSEKTLILS